MTKLWNFHSSIKEIDKLRPAFKLQVSNNFQTLWTLWRVFFTNNYKAHLPWGIQLLEGYRKMPQTTFLQQAMLNFIAWMTRNYDIVRPFVRILKLHGRIWSMGREKTITMFDTLLQHQLFLHRIIQAIKQP